MPPRGRVVDGVRHPLWVLLRLLPLARVRRRREGLRRGTPRGPFGPAPPLQRPRCVPARLDVNAPPNHYSTHTGYAAGAPVGGAILGATGNNWRVVAGYSGSVQVLGALCLVYGASLHLSLIS